MIGMRDTMEFRVLPTQLRNRVSDPPTPQRPIIPETTWSGGSVVTKKRKSGTEGKVFSKANLSQRGRGLPLFPQLTRHREQMGTTLPDQTQPSLSTPRQLLVYDETHCGETTAYITGYTSGKFKTGP